MRSSSRRPCRSNRQSSTLVALAENNAKFVPRPSQVAPRGCGLPAETRTLSFRDQENCCKRRSNKRDLGDGAVLQRLHPSGVPDIAAAIDGGIGVQDLAPGACKRHLNAVVSVDLRREIDNNHTIVPFPGSFAQPRKDAAVGVVRHQPLETVAVAVAFVKCWQFSVDRIEIANERANAGVTRLLEEMPVQRMIVSPFMFLGKFVAHEQQLLAWVAEHESVKGP